VSGHVTLELPPELIEVIARRAAQIVLETQREQPEPWLGAEAAAAYLASEKSRIYALVSKRAIPFHKDGTRLLFRASELDRFVEEGGATRP
jgi:excisionase family DNA binding protein